MRFKEKVASIRDWCKEHKTGIIVTVVGVAGGVATYYGVQKTIDVVKLAKENAAKRNDDEFREFEMTMFINGIRKQFLGCEGDEQVSDITNSVDALKSICSEGGLCGLRNGENILVMTQDVAAEHGNAVLEAVRNAYSDIDDLQIWVSGTIKE